MRQFHGLMLFLSVMLIGFQQASALEAEAYQNCAALSKTAPAEALKQADTSLRKAYSPEAEHCRAQALFGLRRYEEAARALEHVFTQTPPQEVVLSVNLLRQAARAWEQEENYTLAQKRYTRAIDILHGVRKATALTSRLLAETLLDYGIFLSAHGDPYAALQALDQAVASGLLAERAFLARARLLLQLEQIDMAQQDVEMVLRLSPDHPKAQELLRQIVSHTGAN